MDANQMQLTQLVRAFLPRGAELLTIEGYGSPQPAVYAADLDGDGVNEVAAAYRSQGEAYLLVLKYRDNAWTRAANVKGTGYQVSVLTAAPVTNPNINNLIVGWRVGSIWSKLSVYEWTANGLQDIIAPPDANFSYMQVQDMPSDQGEDGRAEFALWLHDTGEAYIVEVVRWHDGKLVPAPDVYFYYFPIVVRYYEHLVRQYPDYAFYWYYLADAQIKAGMKEAAAISIEKGLNLNHEYPSKEKWQELQQQLEYVRNVRMAQDISLFPASVKTIEGVRWGFIDSKGTMIIQPQYEYASDFQNNGLAVVQMNGQNGLINSNGAYVVKPVYDSISPFSEGRAVVIDSQGFKVMDEAGHIITKKAYDYIASYSNGRAMASVANPSGPSLYGFLDLHGNEVIKPQFEQAGDFKQNKTVVKVKDNDFALIGLDGRKLASYPYASVGQLGDGLLPFQQQLQGKYGYIDEKGSIVIQPAYTYAMAFMDGRAVVNTAEDFGSRYGLIDKQANYIIKPDYNEIRTLGEQRLALGKAIDAQQPFIGSTFAIADMNGQMLTSFKYHDVGDFKQGLASVNDQKQTYFIDRNGKAADGYPKVNGSGVLSLTPPLIQANVDQRLSYFDRSGRVIWQQNTVIPLTPPLKVKEEKYKPNKDYLIYYPQIEGMANKAAQKKVNAVLKEKSQVKKVPAHEQLSYSYTGDFNIEFYKKNLLVLELTGYNFPFGAAHGMPSKQYVHVNLVNGQIYELKDLFKPGSNYVKVLSDIVGKQIKEDPQYSYVFPDTYKGIKPNQPFFISDHALHLYFEPYDIAPYVAGFPTFTIPFAEIISIIAVNGDFWKSFH
ncbi:WG repeat-containing protein [Paenibacillus radicis (ex Xue et al. 2023)]|uniref:WG repeat-containing protein n=1 Tax=Paenibacillus radicis (ex Xue et al. 2023) TaxID=2972489 RepID=A0ABT1YR66_9BACL|nr:WG repeat-containing protein [Paenibacillus radicis (ex Xue et al. 2023)]MCR8635680.1 WG repeat-containing protein [Paenibacillus radicis (ex Xue et al. 2023)]